MDYFWFAVKAACFMFGHEWVYHANNTRQCINCTGTQELRTIGGREKWIRRRQ